MKKQIKKKATYLKKHTLALLEKSPSQSSRAGTAITTSGTICTVTSGV